VTVLFSSSMARVCNGIIALFFANNEESSTPAPNYPGLAADLHKLTPEEKNRELSTMDPQHRQQVLKELAALIQTKREDPGVRKHTSHKHSTRCCLAMLFLLHPERSRQPISRLMLCNCKESPSDVVHR